MGSAEGKLKNPAPVVNSFPAGAGQNLIKK